MPPLALTRCPALEFIDRTDDPLPDKLTVDVALREHFIGPLSGDHRCICTQNALRECQRHARDQCRRSWRFAHLRLARGHWWISSYGRQRPHECQDPADEGPSQENVQCEDREPIVVTPGERDDAREEAHKRQDERQHQQPIG